MPGTNEVWTRIVAHEGQSFRQVRGQEFRYKVDRSSLTPSTIRQKLAKSEFEKALARVPLANTVPLRGLRICTRS
jgi:hypothetical protein